MINIYLINILRILTLSRIKYWNIILHIQKRKVIWYCSKKHDRPSVYFSVGLYTKGYLGDERLSSLSNVGSSAFSWFSAHLLLLSRQFVFHPPVQFVGRRAHTVHQNLNPIWAHNACMTCYCCICDDRIGVSEFNKCKQMIVACGLKTGVFTLNREVANSFNVLWIKLLATRESLCDSLKRHLRRGNKPLSMVAVTKPGSGYTHKLWARKREMIPFVC